MRDLPWLTSRPIAHRGLHNKEAGCVENTSQAVKAAISRNFSIEVDLQQTNDEEAIVFHDEALERLTEGAGEVVQTNLADLRKLKMRGSSDPMWTLDELLEIVNGSVPLVIELKSLFRGDYQDGYLTKVGKTLSRYKGPIAVKSFDPHMLRLFKHQQPQIFRGALAGNLDREQKKEMNKIQQFAVPRLLHMVRTQPDFISYRLEGLPVPIARYMRRWRQLPIISWTVKSPQQQQLALLYADQIVFEGFDPDIADTTGASLKQA
ncbi:glycerophosphodiester phosphodiesterase family protein [Flexibacterium corallicola]|uniref:glycerophosphodiester phosphodiesterase family protein n=1 Tax=Flexibacterium corallicola TaxID=3037259 RepID=UPI00286F0BCC|nr:glycerophosphodiester phosphodiesterase family protein [Pseudovibrio sp. M1P-2-3]